MAEGRDVGLSPIRQTSAIKEKSKHSRRERRGGERRDGKTCWGHESIRTGNQDTRIHESIRTTHVQEMIIQTCLYTVHRKYIMSTMLIVFF